MGALTKRGYLQEVENGKALRDAYLRGTVADFLPESYSPKVVEINSDDEERTIHSAQALMSGLFPSKKDAAPSPTPNSSIEAHHFHENDCTSIELILTFILH